MPNQIRFPYGDAFLVNTPNIDQIGKNLYQQEQQKKLYQQQQEKALDDNFSKELVNIKKADIPEVVQKYNDFKQAHINLMKKGRNSTPEDQYAVLQKRADVAQSVGASVEDKERIKNYGLAKRADKKRLFNTNADETLSNYLNTPTSQRNLDNDHKDLFYQYAVPDLSKEVKVAKGDLKNVEVPIGVNKNDKFKDDKEVYGKVGNNPNDFYNSMFSQMAARSDHDNYSGLMMNKYSDDELEKLKTDYAAKISDPKFIAIHGKVQPFPESSTQTDLGKGVAIQTMEDVVNTPIKADKVISVPNQERIKADAHQFAKEQQQRSINAAIQRQRIGFNHTDAKDATKQQENNQWIDSFIDDGVQKSKNYPLIDGVRTVPLDVVSGNAFKKGQIPAVALSISEDGQTFTPIYPTYDEKNNPTATPNPALSQPMDRSGIKLGLGYKTVTKKDLGNVMNSGSDKEVKVQIGGKIYKIPKSNLTKMDSDKVKYKVIE